MSEVELKPCPCCGFKPDIEDSDSCYPVSRERDYWSAGCVDSAGGCGLRSFGESMHEAIEKWNTRTSGWISVDERLPFSCVSVLAYIGQVNSLSTSRWAEVVYIDNGKWKSFDGSTTFGDGEQVTHWMPLPSAPEE